MPHKTSKTDAQMSKSTNFIYWNTYLAVGRRYAPDGAAIAHVFGLFHFVQFFQHLSITLSSMATMKPQAIVLTMQ
jgi:hypothetical protein